MNLFKGSGMLLSIVVLRSFKSKSWKLVDVTLEKPSDGRNLINESLRPIEFCVMVGDCPNLKAKDLWETSSAVMSLLVDVQILANLPVFVG